MRTDTKFKKIWYIAAVFSVQVIYVGDDRGLDPEHHVFTAEQLSKFVSGLTKVEPSQLDFVLVISHA